MSEDAGDIEYQILDPERDADGDLVPNRRASWACPHPARATSSSTLRERGTTPKTARSSVSSTCSGSSTRPTSTPMAASVHPDLGFRPGGREACLRGARRLHHRSPGSESRASRLPLQPLRAHLHRPAHELHETREEALGHLMGRFATREDEVDDLFRLGVFVDLYRVVRQALRAGVECYSIKRLETAGRLRARIDLEDATRTSSLSSLRSTRAEPARTSAAQIVVAGYNEDDCRATLALRDWLEARRIDLAATLGEPTSPPVAPGEGARPRGS